MLSRSADTFKLPQELLADAKAYLRIDHCDDDRSIMMMLGAVIDQFERTQDMTLHPSQITWTVEGDFINGEIRVAPEQRITPISAWTASIPGPVDVTAGYSLRTLGLHGVQFYSLIGAAQAGLELAITAGYASAAAMPFGIQSVIFQNTSKVYEYRDVLIPSNLDELPDWINRQLAGFWVPAL